MVPSFAPESSSEDDHRPPLTQDMKMLVSGRDGEKREEEGEEGGREGGKEGGKEGRKTPNGGLMRFVLDAEEKEERREGGGRQMGSRNGWREGRGREGGREKEEEEEKKKKEQREGRREEAEGRNKLCLLASFSSCSSQTARLPASLRSGSRHWTHGVPLYLQDPCQR